MQCNDDRTKVRICIHVDDLLLTYTNNNTIDNFANFLRSKLTDVKEVINLNAAGDIKLSQSEEENNRTLQFKKQCIVS